MADLVIVGGGIAGLCAASRAPADARSLARLSALALTLAACSSAPVPQPSAVVENVRVSSTGIDANGFIDIEHTCDGADRQLPLTWTGVPDNAVQLAVTMTDRDAGGFVHWVVVGLSTIDHAEGFGGEIASTIHNDFGKPGYGGPCPPVGDAPHEYEIVLHVLGSPITTVERDELFAELARLRIDAGTLVGVYERQG